LAVDDHHEASTGALGGDCRRGAERIDRHPSVKGSTSRTWADDRTVVIVRL